MLNNNAFKTSLIFLGIIFVTLVIRLLTGGHELLVKQDTSYQSASSSCVRNNTC